MNKPTYYLWYNSFSSRKEYEQAKEKISGYGFRVVTYFDGQKEKNIHYGLKQLIINHLS